MGVLVIGGLATFGRVWVWLVGFRVVVVGWRVVGVSCLPILRACLLLGIGGRVVGIGV